MIKKPETKPEEYNENKSQEIPVDEPNNEPANVQVDFMTEEAASSYASQQTKVSQDTINPNTSADDIQRQVNDYENSKSGKLEYKDLLQYATWIINLVDVSLSTALNWWAKDSSLTAYALPEEKKKILAGQLAIILSKYQNKFKVEFLFFIGIVVMYSAPVIAAVSNRKLKIAEKKKIPEKKISEAYYKHVPEPIKKEVVTNEIDDDMPIIEKEITLPLKKRGPKKKYAS